VQQGLIDTNVLIHAQTNDRYAEECLQFLEAVASGRIRARLEPIVLHELAYALPHYRKDMKRTEVAEYLLAVLSWDGIVADKSLLVDVVERWRDTPGLAFVDAFLAALAGQEDCAVYSKNVTELAKQGVLVPNPLPTSPIVVAGEEA
jgi:predicted nucleic acid-binding protein